MREYLQSVEGYEGLKETCTFGETRNVEVGPEANVYEWSDEDGDFVSLGPAVGPA